MPGCITVFAPEPPCPLTSWLTDSSPPQRSKPTSRHTPLLPIHCYPWCGAFDPLSLEEVSQLLGTGSNATALDELPNTLLRHLQGHGVRGIHQLLLQLRPGTASTLLSTVLHIPLRKKEPAWLLANSRPVLLEPSLRRLEATATFRRLQRSFERRGTLPPCMFAEPAGGSSGGSLAARCLVGLCHVTIPAVFRKPTPFLLMVCLPFARTCLPLLHYPTPT